MKVESNRFRSFQQASQALEGLVRQYDTPHWKINNSGVYRDRRGFFAWLIVLPIFRFEVKELSDD